jgi:MoxR-like ATPase
VVATQNPLEFEGTYPLPEAQLDRFLMRVRVGDPPPEAELDMVRAFHQRQGRPPQMERVPDVPTLLELQARAASVACDDSILDYITRLLAGMEGRRLIERRPHPTDSRGKQVSATAHAQDL